jgi:hypothetical protein
MRNPITTPNSSARLYIYVSLGAVLLACASSKRTVSRSAFVSNSRLSWRDEIAADEINRAKVQTAFEAISRLRPWYFATHRTDGTPRATVSASVIVEKGFPQGLDVLRGIPADDVMEIRFIEPHEAMTIHGTQFVGGIIVVRLRPRKPQ